MVGLSLCAVLFVWVIDGPTKDVQLMNDLEKKEEKDRNKHEQHKLDKLKNKYANGESYLRTYKGRKEITTTQRTRQYGFLHHVLILVMEVGFCIIFIALLKRQVSSA